MKHLLYGKDQHHGIKKVDRNPPANCIRLRTISGQCGQEYYPWYLNSKGSGSPLQGDQHFRYMEVTDSSYYSEIKQDLKNYTDQYYFPKYINEGFMLTTGVTCFMGMKPADLSVMVIDIETVGLDPTRPEAEIILINCLYRDIKGVVTKHQFGTQESTTQQNVEVLIRLLHEQKPDIILGHNIFRFDLPFLFHHGLDAMGGIYFDGFQSRFRKTQGEGIYYENIDMDGVNIIDTQFLSIQYDNNKFDFPGYGLKLVEKHLGLVDDSRVEWDFQNDKTNHFRKWTEEKWNKFKTYGMQDVESPLKLWDLMIPAYFELCKMLPMNLQDVVLTASGTQLNNMLMRSYLQEGHSVPKPSPKKDFKGALTFANPGVYQNVRGVDVKSLYPSLMLEYQVYDSAKDPQKHSLQILDYLRSQRLHNKAKFKETGDSYFNDLQQAQKIIINSMYGFLGAPGLNYNNFKGAAEVTKYGREILTKAKGWVESKPEFDLVNGDTDGLKYANSKDGEKELEELNELFPDMIEWEDDGLYDGVIVLASKNYILNKDGELTIKGASLRNKNKESLLVSFQYEVIEYLLGGREEDIVHRYDDHCAIIGTRADIPEEFSVKKNISAKLLASERKQEKDVRDALDEAVERGVIESYEQGDRYHLYRTKDDTLRVVGLYDGDHSVRHYLKRLWATLNIFAPVFDIKRVTKYHLKTRRKNFCEILGFEYRKDENHNTILEWRNR